MKIPLRLAFLLAVTLPVALSANEYHPSSNYHDGAVSVPDTTSTLLLLGTGLGALLVMKKKKHLFLTQ